MMKAMPSSREPPNRPVLAGLRWLLIGAGLFLFLSCQKAEETTIEDLRADGALTEAQLISVTGRRDGDFLPVRVVFEVSASKLVLDLRVRIGVPTRLESGQYSWEQDKKLLEGRVRARSVTFLGGQSDHPNLGGVFELLSADGSPLYKVVLPVAEVRPSEGMNRTLF